MASSRHSETSFRKVNFSLKIFQKYFKKNKIYIIILFTPVKIYIASVRKEKANPLYKSSIYRRTAPSSPSAWSIKAVASFANLIRRARHCPDECVCALLLRTYSSDLSTYYTGIYTHVDSNGRRTCCLPSLLFLPRLIRRSTNWINRVTSLGF